MSRRPRTLAATALAATALLVLSGCGATPVPADAAAAESDVAAADRGTTLVIGSVSDDPEEEADVFEPFVDHLASLLGDEGVTGGAVVVAPSIEEMAQLLRDGEVDLYVDSMNGITTVLQAGVAAPVARRWKDGSPEYHSVLVARRDSGITTPDQLLGRTIAFEEETSTDGYFLASATLQQQGFRLAQVAEAASPAAPDEIGYVFSGDDENTVFLVLDGRVAAGALSQEDLAENAGSRADELVTVARTIDVPRHGVVVRSDLDPALIAALSGVLNSLHETAEGREVLEEFDGTARFDVLSLEALAPVMQLRSLLSPGAP